MNSVRPPWTPKEPFRTLGVRAAVRSTEAFQ